MSKKPANAYAGVRQNVTLLVQDLIRLVDLQVQLLTLDVGEFWNRSRFALVMGVIGGTTLLGAIPVMLLGLAEWVRSNSSLSIEASRFAVAGAALLLAAIALWLSIRQLTKAGESLQRSRSELQANLQWLRTVLNHDED